MAEEKKKACPCRFKSCPRNKDCQKCQAYHRANGGKTSCG